jgi:bifunctional non-homologous end joining protein LigD
MISEPYQHHRRVLEALALSGPSWCTALSFRGDPHHAITACLEQELEGVVLKRLGSRHALDKRSRHWVKAKTAAWRSDHAPGRHE